MIQKALKEGMFKLADKKGGGMTVDTNLFPSATINMVSTSAENKRTRKEASSSQHIQRSKQVWRPRSMVVKEKTRALSYDASRKNEKKKWMPKFQGKIEIRGQHEQPWQSVFQRIQFPQ